MMTFFVVLHITVSILLILMVMMQGSKSEGLTGLFGGGGSTTVFGTGTRSFLARVTTVLGVIFMITSISLTIALSKRSPSVMEGHVVEEEETASPSPEE